MTLAAYGHCKRLYTMKYKEIKAYHMQDCIDSCNSSYATQRAIKNLFRHMDRFAIELDAINRMYHELLTIAPTPESKKKPFTEDEINKLWAIHGRPWVDSVLTFLYTGFRISELLGLKISDIDLEQKTFKGGVKTDAKVEYEWREKARWNQMAQQKWT